MNQPTDREIVWVKGALGNEGKIWVQNYVQSLLGAEHVVQLNLNNSVGYVMQNLRKLPLSTIDTFLFNDARSDQNQMRCYEVLENIKDIQNPVLLHVLTKKGKGMVSLDMKNGDYHDDAVKFHAVKPNGKAKPPIFDTKEKLHQGIAKRHFTRVFTIADDVKVNGAEMKDGMLIVSLEKIVPEEKKPRTISIK